MNTASKTALSPIETVASKALPEFCDASYYLEMLFKNPEGEWFAPKNATEETYTICDLLARHHVIARRTFPLWSSGSFKGIHTEFMYRKDMQYR